MIRVRFAPSPTGHLHVGGLRAALFNWLFARHYGGTFLLRIEDTDIERSQAVYTDSLLQALEWCSLRSDEPVLIQSQRLPEHRQLIEKMLAQGTAYKCYCTVEELEKRLRPDSAGFTKYDQKCRDCGPQSLKLPFVVRFKLPADRDSITFHDMVHGPISFNLDTLDDFIMVRSDGTPMYNFVVVADDAFMRITHVIRGEEHLSNTPKQILIYEALGYQIPKFAHLPLILGPSGNKLSKRDAAVAVIDYKKQGFLPWALCNYLARLGWSHGDQEIFTREEMIQYFTLEHVSKKGAIFDIKKLEWVNSVYLRSTGAQELLEYIIQEYDPAFGITVKDWNREQIIQAIALYKERVKTVRELLDEIILLYSGPGAIPSDKEYATIILPAREWLQETIKVLTLLETWDIATVTNAIQELIKKAGIKLPALAYPLRIALVGKTASPGIFELITLIGKEKTVQRIQKLLEGELQ